MLMAPVTSKFVFNFFFLDRYYISQQLTDKSDVYSFGVILLELISGQEAISNESFGVNCRNIVQWVSFNYFSANIEFSNLEYKEKNSKIFFINCFTGKITH